MEVVDVGEDEKADHIKANARVRVKAEKRKDRNGLQNDGKKKRQ